MVRAAAVAALALALAVNPAMAAPAASIDIRSLLAGEWSASCGDDDLASNAAFQGEYEFEFARSGGNVRFNDGADIEVRGPITSLREQSGDILIDAVLGREHAIIHLRRTDAARVALVETARTNGAEVVVPLTRCDEPDPSVVAHLSWASARALTVDGAGHSIYFVAAKSPAGRDACTADDAIYLHFDLIGPANYYVWRYGKEVGDTFWSVREAANAGTTVHIVGHAESGDIALNVSWRDPRHIFVQPWNALFTRCSNV